MKILKEQSPEGTEKPVIAAWIFTHAHNDHIGVFNHFSDDFHDKVVIEGIYYNFPVLRRVGRDVQNFYYHLENNYLHSRFNYFRSNIFSVKQNKIR